VSATGPKSYIDILEHITAGGVQVVSRVSEVHESPRESERGGVMSAEVMSQTHRSDSAPQPVEPPPRRNRRRP